MKRLVVLALLAACGNKSKLEQRSGAVDALWDLAPDQTEVGIVASPRGAAAFEKSLAAVEELASHPDLASVKPEIDELATALYGSPTGKPADAGMTTDRGFAMFITSDGVIGVMPVADRDKFLASKHGKRGSGSGADSVNGNPCKPFRDVYVCVTSDKLFDRIGKGGLRGKPALAGARGDLEIYAPALPLLGGTAGELAITAELGDGTMSMRGKYTGSAGGTLGKLAGAKAPRVDPKGTSGFVAIDIAKLIEGSPPIPLTNDVTLEDFTKTIKGPVTVAIPSGTVDLQIHVPLTDPAPANSVIEHCDQIEILDRTEQQQPGACRFRLQAASLLELDAWVEGNELRLGAHKGPPSQGKAGGTTAIGDELAAGDWSAMFWGRGTMLNVAGVTPSSVDLPPEAALAIHGIALIDEFGAAIKLDNDGATFRLYVRTAWANPPEVVAKLTAISGGDIANGKVTDQAKAIVAAAPDSPFAADYAAGQGGLMVPAAVVGLVAAIIVPALRLEAQTPLPPPDQPAPVDQSKLVSLLVHAFVEEAWPAWSAANPGKACPASLAELASFLGAPPDIPTMTDPWNQPLVLLCGKDLPPGVKGIAVLSIGPDGKQGTADDIRSWDKKL